ncbi:MAG: hypothetical protein KTR14_03150 [Vampirovibrio sp.]|nr:hypothetical protein [Vampirovibrio sp.]
MTFRTGFRGGRGGENFQRQQGQSGQARSSSQRSRRNSRTQESQQSQQSRGAEPRELNVSRELDGVSNTGAVGELLNIGTDHLANANKYFLLSKYQVSGLTAEDNEATSKNTNPLSHCEMLTADDMYVAGDPWVGGKGNNYAAEEITPETGYLTMFEDGLDDGRKVTINAHVDSINPEGDTAFTEYGFVLQDDDGAKTTAVLSGGELLITGPDGAVQKLLPGETYTVGDPDDPVAKFYYADMPGGENGSNEQRVVFESYEKPSQTTLDSLIARGADADAAAALRTMTQASFGFRVPDDEGTFRMSGGVGDDSAMSTTADGVKTYYDAHFNEGNAHSLMANRPGSSGNSGSSDAADSVDGTEELTRNRSNRFNRRGRGGRGGRRRGR